MVVVADHVDDSLFIAPQSYPPIDCVILDQAGAVDTTCPADMCWRMYLQLRIPKAMYTL